MKGQSGLHDQETPDSEFERLVASRRQKLLGVARRVVRDDSEAEDVVQNTLMAVWRRAGESRIENLERYVLRAVRINALKHRARRTTHASLDDRDLASPNVAGGGDDEFEIDPLTLERAIRRLPAAQQTAIRMRYYLGLSFAEIGKRLSVSMNTAASRCRYALEKLRRLLPADED